MSYEFSALHGHYIPSLFLPSINLPKGISFYAVENSDLFADEFVDIDRQVPLPKRASAVSLPSSLCLLLKRYSGKYHIVTVVAVIERAVHTADRCCGSACLLCDIQVRLLCPQHSGHLKSLGQ